MTADSSNDIEAEAPEVSAVPLAQRHGAPRPEQRARRTAKQLTKLWRHLLRFSGLTHVAQARAVTQQRIAAIDKQNQIQLLLDYSQRAHSGSPLPAFEDTEFRCFSQNGEDGLLLYLFALIGFSSRCAVEICASDGIQCNSANLIVNHGFSALLVDGRQRKLEQGRRFYEQCPEVSGNMPHLAHAWVTRDSIDALIAENGFRGEIDLLSIDLDGMDYWTWAVIECVTPRVVVAEYNNRFSAERAVSVPYSDNFRWPHKAQPGASLGALVKLGRERGYRLVGCQRSQFNAFFVARGEGEQWLPEIAAATCLGRELLPEAEQQRLVESDQWVEV
jgi:hypothetical protein